MSDSIVKRIGVRRAYELLGSATVPEPSHVTRARVRCPSAKHTDSHASCDLDLARSVWKCRTCGAGGGVLDMVIAAGKANHRAEAAQWLEEQVDGPRVSANGARRVVASFPYKENGKSKGRVDRVEPGRNGRAKEFFPYLALPQGGFAKKAGLNGTTLPLYRVDKVRAAIAGGEAVYLVEGEGKADTLRAALRSAGSVAAVTTIQGGASAPMRPEHAASLAGAPQVVVLGDSDDAGRGAMRSRAQRIADAYPTCDVRAIDFYADRTDGSDVADWLAEDHTLDELEVLVHGAPRVEGRNGGTDDIPEHKRGARLRIVNAEDVALVPISWLIRNRIPRDELTIFDGDGGIGKTTVAVSFIAALTTGAPLPDGSCRGPMTCLIVAEEDRRETLVARLRVADADLSRVKFAPVVEWVGGEGTFRIPEHVPLLQAAAAEVCAEYIYIDALFDHFGSAADGKRLNPSQPADVREALRPLTRLAHENGKTINATRHWKKSTESAKHRGYGAADVTNVARAVLAFAPHPRVEGRYVITTAKQNLGKQTEALVYSIASATVLGDDGSAIHDEDGVPWEVGRIAWHGTENISADDVAMATPLNPDERSALEEAKQAILDALAGGEQDAAELEKLVVTDAGIAPVTFRRGRRDLHAEKRIARSGGGVAGPVRWHLVPLNLIDPIKSHTETMSRNGRDEILWPAQDTSTAATRVEHETSEVIDKW